MTDTGAIYNICEVMCVKGCQTPGDTNAKNTEKRKRK
jgi:hypothetical protein